MLLSEVLNILHGIKALANDGLKALANDGLYS